jgi:N-methylhydantoinase A
VRLDDENAAERCAALVAELVEEAERGSFGAGGDSDVRLTLGIRYVGQGYELRVPIDPGLLSPTAIAEEFHSRYERAYGYRDDQPVEVVTWQLALVRPRRGHAAPAGEAGGTAPPVPGRRRAYFPETGLVAVDVYDRSQLRSGDAPAGPCLIAETTTTTVVLPGDRVEVAADGALLVHIGAAA